MKKKIARAVPNIKIVTITPQIANGDQKAKDSKTDTARHRFVPEICGLTIP